MSGLALCGQAADSTQRARRALDQLLAGEYAALFASFSPQMQAALPEGKMASQLAPTLKALGKPVSMAEPVVQSIPDGDVVVINVTFAAVSIDFQFMVMPDGRIGGLFLRPVQPPG